MSNADKRKVQDLLQRLAQLERLCPAPEEAAILSVARQALEDEIQKLTYGSLAVYRNGDNLDAISLG